MAAGLDGTAPAEPRVGVYKEQMALYYLWEIANNVAATVLVAKMSEPLRQFYQNLRYSQGHINLWEYSDQILNSPFG